MQTQVVISGCSGGGKSSIVRCHRKVLETGTAALNQVFEGEAAYAPGEKRVWMQSWFPAAGLDRKPSGVGVIVQDITEQRRAEQHLRESEEQFRALVDASAQMVWMADESGRIIEEREVDDEQCLTE